MYNWKTRFMKLVLDGEPDQAESLMKEYLVSETDVIDGINVLSELAISNMEDTVLVDGLYKVVKKLEESLQ